VASRESLRGVARCLSGYLCGTHSGLLGFRRRHGSNLDDLARVHRELPVYQAKTAVTLGTAPWRPVGETGGLARTLRSTLAHPAVVDLVFFGSQARGSTTGFSDIDAILVIRDAVAEDPNALRALRPHVLAAQRAVIAHQPMQHHGFELATPKLLLRANHALAMPAAAVTETQSLMGRTVAAAFAPDPLDERRARLSELVRSTSNISAWPPHPWHLHRLVSMFELLPALYLQARGVPVTKWRSFAEVRVHFGDDWWPYDVLERVRDRWPRRSAPMLSAGSAALRNPWVAVAMWSRLPARSPKWTRGILSFECLEALRSLAREMGDERTD
jgi:hypothetical protein